MSYNKTTNKLRKLSEDLKYLNEVLERAKKNNKLHFAKRIQMIIKDKEEKIKNISNLD